MSTEPPIKSHDFVNHPPHYTFGKVECIEAIESSLGPEGFIAFLRGQVIKYTWRLNHKWDAAQDAEKAKWYLEKLCAALQAKQDQILSEMLES